MIEGRREDLAGITRNLLSPQNLDIIKGAYDRVAGMFGKSPTNAVDGGTTKEGNFTRGIATKDATRPPSDHSCDKVTEDNIITIVEAKMALQDLDSMDCDAAIQK